MSFFLIAPHRLPCIKHTRSPFAQSLFHMAPFLCLLYGFPRLHLDFSDDKKLTIDLENPIKSEQIIWPSSELVKDIPIPQSLVGEVSTENSEAYAVYLVQIESAYFLEYISLCMDNGFNVDYSKSDTYFSAENGDGISLTVEYRGFNILYIYVENYDW